MSSSRAGTRAWPSTVRLPPSSTPSARPSTSSAEVSSRSTSEGTSGNAQASAATSESSVASTPGLVSSRRSRLTRRVRTPSRRVRSDSSERPVPEESGVPTTAARWCPRAQASTSSAQRWDGGSIRCTSQSRVGCHSWPSWPMSPACQALWSTVAWSSSGAPARSARRRRSRWGSPPRLSTPGGSSSKPRTVPRRRSASKARSTACAVREPGIRSVTSGPSSTGRCAVWLRRTLPSRRARCTERGMCRLSPSGSTIPAWRSAAASFPLPVTALGPQASASSAGPSRSRAASTRRAASSASGSEAVAAASPAGARRPSRSGRSRCSSSSPHTIARVISRSRDGAIVAGSEDTAAARSAGEEPSSSTASASTRCSSGRVSESSARRAEVLPPARAASGPIPRGRGEARSGRATSRASRRSSPNRRRESARDRITAVMMHSSIG